MLNLMFREHNGVCGFFVVCWFLPVFRLLQPCVILLFPLNHSLLFLVTVFSNKVYRLQSFPLGNTGRRSHAKLKKTLNDDNGDDDDDGHDHNEDIKGRNFIAG